MTKSEMKTLTTRLFCFFILLKINPRQNKVKPIVNKTKVVICSSKPHLNIVSQLNFVKNTYTNEEKKAQTEKK
jgi:hypothetical protein